MARPLAVPPLLSKGGGRPKGAKGGFHLIPARMNDCTNCRWNSRNPTSSGADVISVAAVMIDQSTPWSVDEKTCSPTVNGRDSTELVMISGYRKLFQWWLTETSA